MGITLPAPDQRKWWIIGTVGLAVATALAIWFGISATSGINWQTDGYHYIDDQHMELTFDVINQSGKPVTCDLHALDFDHNQVGVLSTQLPASNFNSTTYTRVVPTITRAVMAEVVTCRYR